MAEEKEKTVSHISLTLEELCDLCETTPDFVHELIAYGTVEPESFISERLIFDVKQLDRVKSILRLQHDLEVNLPGAALAIDLLDQIDQLNFQMRLLVYHLIFTSK